MFQPNICTLTFGFSHFLKTSQLADNYFRKTRLRFTYDPGKNKTEEMKSLFSFPRTLSFKEQGQRVLEGLDPESSLSRNGEREWNNDGFIA